LGKRSRHAGIALLLITAALAILSAQGSRDVPKQPAFDVTSVKQNTSGEIGMGGPGDRFQNGQFRLTNRPLRQLIREAFRIRRTDDLIGGPAWLDADRWDIAGKKESVSGDVWPMVRTLLADRFKLVTHYETREVPIYALVIARRDGRLGPSLRPTAEPASLRIAPGLFSGRAPIAMLVDGVLSSAVQRAVVDRTGLTGAYEIELHWTPDGPPALPGDAPPPPASDAPSIFTALQEQLGLKLESDRGPVQVLVIDHVERPTED
jgi:uncharacterized protein (TIGR03435 family)